MGAGEDSRDLGRLPAPLRLPHGGVLSARGLLHRRASLPPHEGRGPRLRVPQGGVRRARAPARADRRATSTNAPQRQAALPLGASLRAARAVRARTPSTRSAATSSVDAYDSEIADRRRRASATIVDVVGEAAARRRLRRERRPRRGVRRSRRPLPRHDRLRGAGAGAARRRRARACRRASCRRPCRRSISCPTTLAALDVPQPARVRGRDLGRAARAARRATGRAGPRVRRDRRLHAARARRRRLVCVRKIASCTLFDVRTRSRWRRGRSRDRPERVQELRRLTAAIERENGKLEAQRAARRRCGAGSRAIATPPRTSRALFDDARVDIRREAARCAFKLSAPVMAPQLRRALAKDEDAEVRQWSALALARLGGAARRRGADAGAGRCDELLRRRRARRALAAALALAEQGDARGEARARRALGGARSCRARASRASSTRRASCSRRSRRSSAQAARRRCSSRSLDDVRLRPYVVDALGEIGDPRAHGAAARDVHRASATSTCARRRRGRSLRLGAREALLPPLRAVRGRAGADARGGRGRARRGAARRRRRAAGRRPAAPDVARRRRGHAWPGAGPRGLLVARRLGDAGLSGRRRPRRRRAAVRPARSTGRCGRRSSRSAGPAGARVEARPSAAGVAAALGRPAGRGDPAAGAPRVRDGPPDGGL